MEEWLPTITNIHVAITWYMVGIVWFVQINHYPIFTNFDKKDFAAFQKRNIKLTVPLTLFQMITELLSGVYLAYHLQSTMSYIGLGLIILLWISTSTVQVPTHFKLSHDWDKDKFKLLLYSNWFRVILWTSRGVIVFYLL